MAKKDTVTMREHFDSLRAADQRALTIAENARAEAVILARGIQTDKDLEHNNLLRQWSDTRNDFATKAELRAQWEKYEVAHAPVLEYITAQQSKAQGFGQLWLWALGGIGCLTGIGAFTISAIGLGLVLLHAYNPNWI